jgi:hypothetical protein
MNKNIEIDNNLVIKKYPKEIDREYEKATEIYNISKKNDFLSPEPLNFNYSEKKITFNYLDASGTIRDLFRNYLKYGDNKELILDVTNNAGKILGYIHNNLMLKTKSIWFPPEEFIQALLELGYPCKEDFAIKMPLVYLHCDYGISNIKYLNKEGLRKVVVYDSSPNNYYTKHADTYGPAYVDIGTFIAGINGLIPVYEYPFINWNKINEIKSSFISGYEMSTGYRLNNFYVEMFSYGCANCYFLEKYKVPVLQRLAMKILFNSKKSNVPYVV